LTTLNERVALVTGASTGIGRSVALPLASEGAAVVVNYRRSATEAEQVVATICDGGGKAIAVRADVSDPLDASDASSYITGSAVFVDGGLTAR
jgi:3-oxoacyl-[acyl-carrier protein] reductase